MDVFLPISNRTEEFLERAMFDVTENYASEMVLAKSPSSPEGNPAIRTERLSQDDIDTFSTVLMKSYEMPPDVFSIALPILHRTISKALEHPGVRSTLHIWAPNPSKCSTCSPRRAWAVIYNVGVLPESRKHGVARMLMLRAIEDSRAVGTSTLCLQTRAESFQERFYQQLGFEVVARRNRVIRRES